MEHCSYTRSPGGRVEHSSTVSPRSLFPRRSSLYSPHLLQVLLMAFPFPVFVSFVQVVLPPRSFLTCYGCAFADGPRSLLGGLSAGLCITEVGRHFVRRCHFHNGWLPKSSHMAEEMEMGSGARNFMPCGTSDLTVASSFANDRCAVITVL